MPSGARPWNPRDPGGWGNPQTDHPGSEYRRPWDDRHPGDPAGSTWHDAPWNPASWNRPAQIVAIVLGFVLFWPIGLGLLAYLWWSGKMGCFGRRHAHAGAAHTRGQAQYTGAWSAPWSGWFHGGRDDAAPSSGNRAFDEYRQDTLRRLEEEQQEFAAYLDRLRFAKDKAEFDQFMAERWQRPPTPTQSAAPHASPPHASPPHASPPQASAPDPNAPMPGRPDPTRPE